MWIIGFLSVFLLLQVFKVILKYKRTIQECNGVRFVVLGFVIYLFLSFSLGWVFLPCSSQTVNDRAQNVTQMAVINRCQSAVVYILLVINLGLVALTPRPENRCFQAKICTTCGLFDDLPAV